MKGTFRSLRGFNYRVWARRRARLQRRHLDAAHGAGLARPHRADPQECDRRGHRDGAAVRAHAAPAAADRLCGRPSRPPQAAARHPGRDGRARARPGSAHGHRPRAVVAGLSVCVPAWLRHGVRLARTSDLRRRAGRRRGSVERGRAEFHLVQRRADDRPGGGRCADRVGGHRLGVPDQRGLVCRGAGFAEDPARRRTAS